MTNSAAGAAKKSTARTTSSAVPVWPTGTRWPSTVSGSGRAVRLAVVPDQPRRHHVDRDPEAGLLERERARERDDAGLGGRVGAELRLALRRGAHRGEVHDPAEALLAHVRDDQPAHVEDGVEVRGEDPAPLGGIDVDQGLPAERADGVHEHVDAPPACDRLLDEAARLARGR